MRAEIQEKLNMFKVYNDITLKNEIVIFGSTYTAGFPFYELSQKYMFTNAIYNRSIKNLTLEEADQCLTDCVLAIKPSKLFLSLGENDIDNSDAIEIYRNMINKIKEKLPYSTLYIMPVHSDITGAKEFNISLSKLCHEKGINYLNINYSPLDGEFSYNRIFKQLTCFFRKTPISFADAFSMGN